MPVDECHDDVDDRWFAPHLSLGQAGGLDQADTVALVTTSEPSINTLDLILCLRSAAET